MVQNLRPGPLKKRLGALGRAGPRWGALVAPSDFPPQHMDYMDSSKYCRWITKLSHAGFPNGIVGAGGLATAIPRQLSEISR